MADRISGLPDAVLCHILSFLPTKQSVVTSVLSKRWKPLWRYVSALHFEQSPMDCNDTETHRFVQSVYAFILSRDMDQPFRRFYLSCSSFLCDPVNVNAWVSAALQRRVEHLQLWLPPLTKLVLPSALFCCKTLVVLRLIGGLTRNPFPLDFSFVDLPSLTTLHLQSFILERIELAELLRGSSNLEDLFVKDVYFSGPVVEAKFKRLSKLVRATIMIGLVPLEVVNNVEFLRIDWMDDREEEDLIPEFQNLTHLELGYMDYTKDWVEVLEVVERCPNLQILVIDMGSIDMTARGDEEADWPFPRSVPLCISLHLKTCSIISYGGSKGELRFARYIMRKARHLHTMTISTYACQREKFKMLKKLSLCPRRSRICKLSFKSHQVWE